MHHVKDENYYVLLQKVPEVIKMLAELHSLKGKAVARSNATHPVNTWQIMLSSVAFDPARFNMTQLLQAIETIYARLGVAWGIQFSLG